MLKTTRDIEIGDRIDIDGFRGMIVTDIQTDGIAVVWFTPDGIGPNHMVLPHGALHKRRYHDERNGEHKSYFNTHPDFTGRSGEI